MPERFDRVRPSWVAFGWFIAASITALILLGLAAFGIAADGPAQGVWTAVSFVVGFGLAGVIVGMRAADAPFLHGLGMGLFSLVVWLAANLLLGEPTGQTAWSELPARTVASLLVLQTASAVVGARAGVRWARAPLRGFQP